MFSKTVAVPHLKNTIANYALSSSDASKPTIILINSFGTCVDLYKPQFRDKKLTEQVNLLAIDVLGHGQTRTESEGWTYWDTAMVNLMVIEKLGIKGKILALGTSQGGWVAARMALLAPETISGLVLLGTSMDYESERAKKLGCWDAEAALTGSIDQLSTTSSIPEFEFDNQFCDFLIDSGFGKDIALDERDFWRAAVKKNWGGDEGRKRARMSAINLRDRDGLHGRLFDVRCPVIRLHGTADIVYSVENAIEEMKLLVNSADATLKIVEGGHHYLSHSNPSEVNSAILQLVTKHGDQQKERNSSL